MKVLFAVNNENISESIIKKYQQEYKEIISVKNVYYFNAIIKELQRDKTYDRIVISEDLQPFSNNNYDAIDKFIFEKMDNISDEATNQSGNDIPIILICTDRRNKSEPLLVKLFGIGVYNALIGKDRSITKVCELLARPRTKKEAKVYYNIDSDDVDYKVENEGDVSEVEIQNILNHYKSLGNNEQRFVESFEHIASQYTDSQLRLIAKFLPLNVKAVLEANSIKYQEIISFGSEIAKPQGYQPPSLKNTNSKNAKFAKQKKENKKDQIKLDLIEKNLTKNKMTEPVVIPSSINTAKIKKMQNEPEPQAEPKIVQQAPKMQPKVEQKAIKIEPEQIQEIDDILENIPAEEENIIEQEMQALYGLEEEPVNIKETQLEPQIETETIEEEQIKPKKGRGRPKKVENVSKAEDDKPKRGRGRPKKTVEPVVLEQQETVPNVENNEIIEEPPLVNLFDLDEETDNIGTSTKKEDDMFLPGLDDETVFMEQYEDEEMPVVDNSLSDNSSEPIFEQTTETQSEFLNEMQQEEVQPIEQEKVARSMQQSNPNINVNQNAIENTNVSNNSFNQNTTSLTRDKKIVAFVGTSKNGTSFLVNNIAEILSQKGINTAILDLTKNKNDYYIYTENEENLRKIAYSCINNLRGGVAKGIQVHKNLTVYTTLPGESEDINDYANILQTLSQNYSLVLLDCDFETNYGYFDQAQELYLVQSLDVLTIQPLTAFLRNLKAKNILNPEKIRIVLNKVVKLKSISAKTIIGGMAFYNDPAMSFMTELFNKDTVAYCSIPFEEQAYSKYLEGLINCKITLNGYSKNFMAELNKLGDMVYPLVNNNMKNKSNNYNNYKNSNYNNYNNGNNFPSNMNDTLNKMKNNY